MKNSSICTWAELTVVIEVPHGEVRGIRIVGILPSFGLYHTGVIEEVLLLYGTSAKVSQSGVEVTHWWGEQEKCFKLRMTASFHM